MWRTREGGRDRVAIGAARRHFAPWTDADATPLIRFERVTKCFGGVAAVAGVTLDIFAREFFCLLGPSGCGKTTLLRLLAGFEAPDEGVITLAGNDLAGLPPHRRPLNMMFQSYALFPHMSVEANIAFGLKQAGLPRDEIRARVADMLRLVRMAGFGRRWPDQLSGGERQRVALARALARRPSVLLLDEPLAALDRRLREATRFELMEIQMELGTTFVVVTHDQEEAMTMADRIAVMDRGRIVQVATPAEIYEQPASRSVAEFVGDVSIFEARVVERAGGLWRCASDLARAPLVIDDARQDLRPGQAIAIAVRPEKMLLHQDPLPPAVANVLSGVVWDIGYAGDWTNYVVKLDSGAMVRVSRANATRSVERSVTLGAAVHASFTPQGAIILTR